MARITLAEANAWLESTKLNLTVLDATLEDHVSRQVLARLDQVFNTATWTDNTTTPKLVRTIISMIYVAWVYDRAYNDDSITESPNRYSDLLRTYAEINIVGLLDGSVVLEEDPTTAPTLGAPTFFPTDASSARKPSTDFPSDGGPSFMMGTVF